MFMKLYASEAVHCAISGGVDAKSFCKNGHICFFQDLQFSTSSCKNKYVYHKVRFSITFKLTLFFLRYNGKIDFAKCWEYMSGDS